MLLNRASALMSGTSSTSGWSGASVKAHTPMPHGSSAPTALRRRTARSCVERSPPEGCDWQCRCFDRPRQPRTHQTRRLASGEQHTVATIQSRPSMRSRDSGTTGTRHLHVAHVPACARKRAAAKRQGGASRARRERVETGGTQTAPCSAPFEHSRAGSHDEAAVRHQRDRRAVALAHALRQLQ